MPYLVDGHNLIGRMPGIQLDEIDDEMHLIQLLQDFCQKTRKNLEVYFDKAPNGSIRERSFGMVKAIFVRLGTTADQAIQRRLAQLGGEARNWTVVSSDREVINYARAAGASNVRSENFAQMIIQSQQDFSGEMNGTEEKRDIHLTEQEIEDWLNQFGGEK